MTTYAPNDRRGELRREYNERCIDSWARYLRHDAPIHLHLADDGSTLPGWPPFLSEAEWPHGEISNSVQSRRGVGASLNAGMRIASELGEVAAYFADDWELLGALDLAPWVRMLDEEEGIGCVRLGPPHPWLTGMVTAFPQGWAMVLHRHHYAFATRPMLIHRRFTDAYGWFDEGLNAFDTERLMNDRFARNPDGPAVVLAFPQLWDHIGEQEMGDIVPEGGA